MLTFSSHSNQLRRHERRQRQPRDFEAIFASYDETEETKLLRKFLLVGAAALAMGWPVKDVICSNQDIMEEANCNGPAYITGFLGTFVVAAGCAKLRLLYKKYTA